MIRHVIAMLLLSFGCGGTAPIARRHPVAGSGEARDESNHVVADTAIAVSPTHTNSFRVVVISDLNGSYGSTEYGPAVHAAIARIVELRPAAVLSTGDMVAGQSPRAPHREMWRAFHEAVTDRFARAGLPFAVSPGNHDASAYSRFTSERYVFIDEWSRRKPELDYIDDSHYPLRYAFRIGSAVFLSLDATTSGPLSEEQRAWVRNILERTRDDGPHVAFGHVPLYPFTRGRETQYLGDEQLEAIFREFGVDLVLSGHHHGFYVGEKDGLALVSAACLGAGPRALIGEEESSERAIVVIEIRDHEIASIDALVSPDFVRSIDYERLPERLGAGDRTLLRADRFRPGPRSTPVRPLTP